MPVSSPRGCLLLPPALTGVRILGSVQECIPSSLSSKFRDRKSTRLNSSHDQISYAVFCLKKKKKTSMYNSHQSSPPMNSLRNHINRPAHNHTHSLSTV